MPLAPQGGAPGISASPELPELIKTREGEILVYKVGLLAQG